MRVFCLTSLWVTAVTAASRRPPTPTLIHGNQHGQNSNSHNNNVGELDRSLFEFGSLTRTPTQAPMTVGTNNDNPTIKSVNANYTYYLYTAHDNIDTALNEVHAYVESNLQDAIDDIEDGQVTILSIEDTPLVEGCGDKAQLAQGLQPVWYNTSFGLCAKYTTVIQASLRQKWNEDIFRRTTLQVIRTYVHNWNSVPRSSYVQFISPIQVKAEVSVLLVGAKQLMSIYEYSFLGDVMEVSLREQGKMNENPAFDITEIKYLWQRIVTTRNNDDNGSDRRLRRLQGTTTDEPEETFSNHVQILVMAECGTEECSSENLGVFLEEAIPQTGDVMLTNLQDWSETNYFGSVDGIAISDEQNPTLIDEPDLPPEVDYRTPGINEEKAPIWIWLAIFICAGVIVFACVWAVFCLGARDYQAARKLRKERNKKMENQPHGGVEEPVRSPSPANPGFRDEDVEDSDPVPRSPTAKRYFTKKAPPTPAPEVEDESESENQFDVSESNYDPVNSEETPATPKKKKKSKSSSKKKKKKDHVEVADIESLD